MSSSKKRSVWLQILCVSACVGVLLMGLSISTADDKAAEQAATKAADEAKLAEKAKPADPFVVPDGTPDELYAYIESLDALRPQSRDRAAIVEFLKKLIAVRSEACEKILASDTPVEKKKPAAAMLFTTVQMSLRIGDPQAAKALAALPERFDKLKMPKIAEAARANVVGMNLQLAIAGRPGAPPLGEAIAALKKLIEKDPNVDKFRLVLSVVGGLSQSGKTAEAIDLCTWAEKAFAKSEDKSIVENLGMLKGTARRLQLPGKTMVVKGKTLDGKPYDLAKEKGHVVLVQYWATWCKPCIEEISNVMKYYELYHDRGFDVVGISIDSDKATLEEFLKQNKMPWPVLLDSEAEESNAERYGVMGVPTLILVDKEGKVVSLNARGPVLGEELEKLLGPPEKKAAEKKAAEKK